MSEQTSGEMKVRDIADRYYGAFAGRYQFGDVPMADDLHFASPAMQLDGAEAFRGALGGLVQQVKGLEIRHQSVDGDAVLTVYDFDLGLPAGPIPMAERLQCRDGVIAEVELIFDSARMAPPA